MWNYVFGRLMYNLIRGICKMFTYFFIGLTYMMYYSIVYAGIVLWYLVKYFGIILWKIGVFIWNSLIKLYKYTENIFNKILIKLKEGKK